MKINCSQLSEDWQIFRFGHRRGAKSHAFAADYVIKWMAIEMDRNVINRTWRSNSKKLSLRCGDFWRKSTKQRKTSEEFVVWRLSKLPESSRDRQEEFGDGTVNQIMCLRNISVSSVTQRISDTHGNRQRQVLRKRFDRRDPLGTTATNMNQALKKDEMCVNGSCKWLSGWNGRRWIDAIRSQHEQRASAGYSSSSRSTRRRPLRTHECVRRRRRIGRNEFDPDEGRCFSRVHGFLSTPRSGRSAASLAAHLESAPMACFLL